MNYVEQIKEQHRREKTRLVLALQKLESENKKLREELQSSRVCHPVALAGKAQ